MNFHYCEQCKEDFDRINKGYHVHNGKCEYWECHLYDSINLITALVITIPIMIIFLPILLFLYVVDKIKDG